MVGITSTKLELFVYITRDALHFLIAIMTYRHNYHVYSTLTTVYSVIHWIYRELSMVQAVPYRAVWKVWKL